MRILNAYCGIGGNRKLWKNCDVVAVDNNQEILGVYQAQHPNDHCILGDAHEHIRKHFMEYDFIWSSPPCPTHSRMSKFTRHTERRYPSMILYEEILFLQHFSKALFVVENVLPYYEPLVRPTKQIGRHLFWSNFEIHAEDVPTPPDFINLANLEGMKEMQDWLGIHYEKPIYYGDNHCPVQVLRNAVPPKMGLQILESAMGTSKFEVLPLFK